MIPASNQLCASFVRFLTVPIGYFSRLKNSAVLNIDFLVYSVVARVRVPMENPELAILVKAVCNKSFIKYSK